MYWLTEDCHKTVIRNKYLLIAIDTKLNIVFIVTRSDTIGGSHIHVRDMAYRLGQDGHRVTVLIGGRGPVLEHFTSHGIEVHAVPKLCRNISMMNDLQALISIRRQLKKIQPDLVSTHSSKAGFLGRIAARTLGIPVIFTAHGWAFTSGKTKKSRRIFRTLEKSVSPMTDFFITVSDFDRQLGKKMLGVSPDKIMTIHNGMPDIPDSLRADPKMNGVVNIVKVARFDKQKNHEELVRAIHDLDSIHVHFIGDGPLEESIKALVEELKAEEKFTFWGSRDDVDQILAKGQLFALVSNWEGFPRSTIEAMRAGLPVVVSDVGGAGEAITEGVNGFIIRQRDVTTLRNRIENLVSDAHLRQRMGEAARKYYEDYLTFDQMYKTTVSVYQQVLATRSRQQTQNNK